MPGHVKADLTKISAMAKQLNGLASEFNTLTQVADVGSAAGNSTLASTLSNFASGWSDKRNAFVKEMQGLATLATKAVQEYNDTDGKLTKALTQPSDPKGGK